LPGLRYPFSGDQELAYLSICSPRSRHSHEVIFPNVRIHSHMYTAIHTRTTTSYLTHTDTDTH